MEVDSHMNDERQTCMFQHFQHTSGRIELIGCMLVLNAHALHMLACKNLSHITYHHLWHGAIVPDTYQLKLWKRMRIEIQFCKITRAQNIYISFSTTKKKNGKNVLCFVHILVDANATISILFSQEIKKCILFKKKKKIE